MSFARFVSRSLLAGYFIADGAEAVINPESRVDQADPWAQKIIAWSQRVLPRDLARYVPEKTESFVRIHGAVQVAGAVMLSTGILRRPGAALVVAAYAPKVLAALPTSLRADKLPFIRELALLGGALIAVRDTQGKPDLTWLVTERRRFAATERKLAKEVSKQARAKAARQAKAPKALAAN